ncbi:hypothetical protein PsorP6_016225 [Peronosclerospora sorghi]|uniref:Uncharacterized protein n=1 Tax=Peronosclerospora sorghi TaxID=230839 RepID=A0ACC0VM22_9STRA|nr:hypothetical protein PsorP6_016225 [Peronosclerospora sorghi]
MRDCGLLLLEVQGSLFYDYYVVVSDPFRDISVENQLAVLDLHSPPFFDRLGRPLPPLLTSRRIPSLDYCARQLILRDKSYYYGDFLILLMLSM